MNANEKFLALWGKQRGVGLWRWTLINGVMAFGSSCALLAILLLGVVAFRQDPILKAIIFLTVGFPVGGVVFGVILFKWNEARYHELLKGSPEPNATPNGGPATPSGCTGVREGPPSVS
jgi:hypothetical protein